MRLWMLSTITMVAATAMGLALGGYVTSAQRSPLERATGFYEQADSGDAPHAVEASTMSPVAIRCTGCGPTLAERRSAADMARWTGNSMIAESPDPVEQDYLAEAEPLPIREAPPALVHPLPASIARFEEGVAMAQEGAAHADEEPLLPVAPASPQ
ncbi:hypothetical protein MOK15_12835 [Sphingobium sp. BYY-5]|uniref:hypothetical protein n=1 Tax=Sphingobium sp. BYY-5 TaxID=2926400 RepID=UPI001FA7D3A2|nr:hypothetical protein [Sphingobium sp. BYY-5]MCI4590974.1 hypothetical protein [Sphingobium sp. BYY-5]